MLYHSLLWPLLDIRRFILIRTGLPRRLSSEAFNVMSGAVPPEPSPSKTCGSVHAVGENSKSLSQITVVERRPYEKHTVKLLLPEQTSIPRESDTTFMKLELSLDLEW